MPHVVLALNACVPEVLIYGYAHAAKSGYFHFFPSCDTHQSKEQKNCMESYFFSSDVNHMDMWYQFRPCNMQPTVHATCIVMLKLEFAIVAMTIRKS